MTITLDELAQRLRGAPVRARGAMRDAVAAAGSDLRTAAAANIRSRAMRSGRLLDSLDLSVRQLGGDVEVRMVADTPYADIQERGGTVRPRRARHLAVPLVDDAPDSPRQVLDARFVPVRRGTVARWIVLDASGRAVFALVASVTVEGQHFMRDALSDVAARLPQALADGVAESILA